MTNDSRRFVVDGERYSLAEMLDANAEDDVTCDWLRAAKPGDVFDDMHAERIECIAPDTSHEWTAQDYADERAARRQDAEDRSSR